MSLSRAEWVPVMKRKLFRNYFVFFFQAEDGIRDLTVTGVQTCALPIWDRAENGAVRRGAGAAGRHRSAVRAHYAGGELFHPEVRIPIVVAGRSTPGPPGTDRKSGV